MDKCYCGSEKTYENCCHIFHQGKEIPDTAEKLMRARFSAFAVADVKFIMDTVHAKSKSSIDEKSIKEWAEKSTWEKLEIISTNQGTENDSEGEVEFIAHYETGGSKTQHHELSIFKKEQGRWYFVDGKAVGPKQFVRDVPKIGRNEPCFCGSGKKYKKCCAK